MGASLSGLQQPPSQIIDVMSIYHPFPLRLDSLNKGAPVQYDACLQLGEFPSARYKGNSAVVLFPLKVHRTPGPKGKFMDGIASKIPTILGQQPDPITGYPDVPAHTGADWSIEDILFMQNSAGETVSRAFYAWINKTPFPVGVVVMAEPVLISQTNMDAIKRLPVTPPSDVIHEIGTPILYKPGPIFDEEGNPKPCPATKAEMSKQAMNSIIQPPVPTKEGGFDLDLFFKFILGALATVIVILAVWAGIKLALGPGSKVMKSLGDSLGRSLAGGYEAIKKAKIPTVPSIPESVKDSVNKTRRNLGNRLGLGSTGNFGQKRQAPTDKSIEEVFPVLKPEKDIEMSNPLFKSKDDFSKFQERNRTRRNPIRQKPKQGTISAITNLPAANIPEPAPASAPAAAQAPSVENIIDDMKPGVTVNPIVDRRRSPQNKRKSSLGSIKNIPQISNTKPLENTPAAISNLPTPVVNPALQEIEDLQLSDARRKQAKSNALRKISANSQARKSQSNAFKNIANRARAVNELDSLESPVKSSRDKTPKNILSDIVKQQSTRKVEQPKQEPGAGTGLLPQTTPTVTPRRRRIIQEEEDEEEVKKDSRDDEYDPTKLFGSKFLRKSYGLNYGGNRRQKRKKTGRKI